MTEIDTRTRLKEYLGTATWELLEPHVVRDTVICVSPDLDLLDVAVAVADDDIDYVQSKMDLQKIRKPSEAELVEWKDENKKFLSIIVSPFVLIKLSEVN